MLRLLALLMTLNSSLNTEAYPNFISYGYATCQTCHYNPFGNGPLTDYGRAVGASAISDRLLAKNTTTEEELAFASGFFFEEPKNSWLRPGISFRDLVLVQNAGKKTQKNRFIIMDFSASLALKFGKDDRYLFVGQTGYAPTPAAYQGHAMNNYRTREHYVGYRPNEHWGIYAGLMDKVYGLRIPEHIAYSRMLTQNNQNDQTHGLLLHYINEYLEVGLQPFVGNYAQDDELRQKGGAVKFEAGTSDRWRLGASILKSESDFTSVQEGAAHGRFGFSKGNSLMIELGTGARKNLMTNKQSDFQYAFTQSHLLIKRGLSSILTLEAMAPKDRSTKRYRVGPGVQYFPFNRVEVRCDIYNEFINALGKTTSTITATSQLHLWL